MNEDRIPFLATKGGKTEQIARAIMDERRAAQQARIDYLKSKGKNVLNLFGGDYGVSALIVKSDEIPDGWRRCSKLHRKYSRPDGEVFAVPDGTKKDTYKALVAELRALPSLPDTHSFSNRLQFGVMIRGNRWMTCSFEFVGDEIIVSVPRYTKPENGENDDGHKKQFVPPGCIQLKMSEYHAMKEKLEAAK